MFPGRKSGRDYHSESGLNGAQVIENWQYKAAQCALTAETGVRLILGLPTLSQGITEKSVPVSGSSIQMTPPMSYVEIRPFN